MTIKTKTVTAEAYSGDWMWEKLKNVELDLYALPDQTLEKTAQRVNLAPDKLHLKTKAPALLSALDSAATKAFKLPKGKLLNITQQHDFIVVSVEDE